MVELQRGNLISRAFNGSVVVDGMRIVAHPSGTLITRASHAEVARRHTAWLQLNALGPGILDRENDWSDV
ncbi:MAG: hypothetical protein KF773_03905 [Deltaproteobacteria bacterium]|nr:hypothetical protein [Deltaproteobacteria bacterium]MCW5804069.1 hypothetical protein [Deltaproteobacteria bacterium]